MFNKKIEERLKKLEARLRGGGVDGFIYEYFDYRDYLREIKRINNRIDKVESNAKKQLQELKDFLEIEEYKPDCTPYLRKKESEDVS